MSFRLIRGLLGTAVLWLGVVPSALAASFRTPSPVAAVQDASLEDRVRTLLSPPSVAYGVAIKHLVTGQSAAVNNAASFPAASLYKLAVLYEFYRQRDAGAISEGQLINELAEDCQDDGETIVGEPGTTLRAAQMLSLMVTVSDNPAGKALARTVGRRSINATLQRLGLSMRIHTGEADDPVPADEPNATTPRDVLALLEQMATNSTEFSPASRQSMLGLLAADQINDRLPAPLPMSIEVAHKTGDLDGIVHDAGIVYAPNGPYIIVALTQTGDADAGRAAIETLSRSVYRYFTPFMSGH